MEILLYQILYILLYLVLLAVLLSSMLGVPGNWILLGVALILALVSRFSAVTWGHLALCAGLATLGEVVEAILGAVVIARRGGTRWGVTGSIIGGFAGALVGSVVLPPFGGILFAFVGAFAGAMAAELVKQRQIEPAMRIGFWSLVGKLLATTGKMALGLGILWIIVTATWP